MSAAGQTMPDKPTVPSDEVVRLRLRLVAEEFFELLGACVVNVDGRAEEIVRQCIREHSINVDLVEAADALADIAYVVEGTALAFGISSDAVLAEVHASNLRKDFGNVPAGGKVRKPDGWVGPDVERVLAEQRWEADRG